MQANDISCLFYIEVPEKIVKKMKPNIPMHSKQYIDYLWQIPTFVKAIQTVTPNSVVRNSLVGIPNPIDVILQVSLCVCVCVNKKCMCVYTIK